MERHDQRWLAASALVCASLIYVYPLLLGTPLIDPDEGMHAAISQRMVETGDYVVPRFQGTPFLDKPILYFEAQAVSLRLFGFNEVAVRLPGLMFALLGAATTGLLAWRLFDRDVALMTLLVALTLAIPLALAQAAAHDIALVPWTNLAWLFLWEADQATTTKRRLLATLGQAVCIALALLSKGLIGVAVVCVGYALFVLLRKDITLGRIGRGALALGLGALIASPWFLAMEHASPGYLFYYFIQRHFLGYATATQEHGNAPWHYYLPQLVGGCMPWTLYLIPGFWQSMHDRKNGRRLQGRPFLMIYCWVFGGLLFLSTANSKLITYALPLYPAIAILIGRDMTRFLRRDLSPRVDLAFTWIFRVSCASGCFFPLALLAGIDRFTHTRSPLVAYVVAAAASTVVIAALVLMHQGKRPAAVAMGVAWFGVLFVTVMTWPFQVLAQNLSQKTLAQQINASGHVPNQVFLVGQHVGSLVFYLSPELRHNLGAHQIQECGGEVTEDWSAVPPGVLLAMNDDAVDEMTNARVKAEITRAPAAGVFFWAQGVEASAKTPSTTLR